MEQDIFIRGNSHYTIADGPSWSEAEERLVKLGVKGRVDLSRHGTANLFPRIEFMIWATTEGESTPLFHHEHEDNRH